MVAGKGADLCMEWQCSDALDKVYGLLAFAATKTRIVADYSKTVRQVYLDVCKAECLGSFADAPKDVVAEDVRFRKLLREVLAGSRS